MLAEPGEPYRHTGLSSCSDDAAIRRLSADNQCKPDQLSVPSLKLPASIAGVKSRHIVSIAGNKYAAHASGLDSNTSERLEFDDSQLDEPKPTPKQSVSRLLKISKVRTRH